MNERVVNQINFGTTFITPTRRLASHCQKRVSHFLKQSSAWETPAIFSWDDWCKMRWGSYEWQQGESLVLISPTQSFLLLEKIIIQSSASRDLLEPFKTAKLAYSAWKILHQWDSLDLLEKENDSLDQQVFREWIREYILFLEAHHFLDEAMLPQKIVDHLIQESPENLIFYGFEEKTPFLLRLIKKLTAKGWKIEWEEAFSVQPLQCYRREWADERQEQEAAVHFVKEQQKKGKKNIAIVIPELADKRHMMEQLLRQTFDPFMLASPLLAVDPRFNISAAIPLSDYPVVQAAMIGLRLGKPSPTSEEVQRAKYSPWLHVEDLFHSPKGMRSYTQWAHFFREHLATLQWPFNPALTSTEYQAVVRFEKLLQDFALCDEVLAPCDYQTAIQTLEKLAAYLPFQPENRNAVIQVLGILEAAGQSFDAVWVMGMHNVAWPPAAQSNPFIDLTIQKQRNMPHASAERELQFASYLTHRLKHSSEEVVFSYTTQSKEQKWQCSELIRDLPLREAPSFSLPLTINPINFSESLEDEYAPPVEKENNKPFPSRLLELQSHCPFRAFGEYRLHLRQPSLVSLWLSASDQGRLFHDILESWWKVYPTQECLLKMTPMEREKKLRTLIDQKLSYHKPTLPPIFLESERARVFIIVEDYFKLEAERQPFKVIATESEKIFRLSSLVFRLRSDRMDQDDAGNKIIVDYKTGKFSTKDWEGFRLASPQLPLYALAYQGAEYRGIVVIRLRLEGCRYDGWVEQDLGIPGVEVREDYQDIQQNWRIELERLSKAFEVGDAKVDPRNKHETCQYCHLHAICRIEV